MTQFTLVAVLVAAFAASGTASAARTGYTTGDPRKCSFNKPAQCARYSAIAVLRVALQKKYDTPSLYQGPTACTQATQASLMRWNCTYGTGGKATVWFRGTSTGWKRVVTVTVTP